MSVTSDILKLKKEKNAVILAHYYVDEDVQEVAEIGRASCRERV